MSAGVAERFPVIQLSNFSLSLLPLCFGFGEGIVAVSIVIAVRPHFKPFGPKGVQEFGSPLCGFKLR